MPLHFYNSYTRRKEQFESITPGYAGLYVCGPTVSGESHLGHARPYITFDVVNRYLQHLGYKVRYVRNITDAGHFEEEGREAIDKVGEKAKLEKMEPMEMVHKYTSLFHHGMRLFNCLEPAIEPTATGHIVEQISMIETIIAKGYAYEVNGSVYFDVKKYADDYAGTDNPYGKLSGRVLEDQLETTRELDGQEEKRNKADFALWKNAPPQHIMRWKSPWGEGFPGWHIECSAMSSKYLGETFDIHGGGMDLQFPHHESEIAQSTIAHGHAPVRYWMHNNMITINGKKMGKSYNNVIKLSELFSGNHPILEQAYHPMTVRFYILQTHYRSTLDFSNEALQGSERALRRLWEAYEVLQKLEHNNAKSDSLILSFEEYYFQFLIDNMKIDIDYLVKNGTSDTAIYDYISFCKEKNTSFSIQDAQKTLTELTTYIFSEEFRYKKGINVNAIRYLLQCEEFMCDDFNTAKVIANLFELAPLINSIKGGNISIETLSTAVLILLKEYFKTYLEDILGLQALQVEQSTKLDSVLGLLIEIRKDAKKRKDFATSDQIRNKLAEAGVLLKDEKDGSVSYTIG